MSLNKTETLFQQKKKEEAAQEKKKSRKELAGLMLSFFVCFGYASFSAAENISPFGVSFLCALPFDFCFSSFLGGVFGYLLVLPWRSAVRYWCALAVCCAVRFFMHRRSGTGENTSVRSVLAAAVIALSSAAYYAFAGFTLRAVIFTVCESLLAFCATVLFIRSIKIFSLPVSESTFRLRDGAFGVISICLFALCISEYTVKGVALGRIAAYSAVMLLSFFRGPSAGSISGVCVGAFLSFQPGFSHLFSVTALGGLVSGVSAQAGRTASALGFCATGVTVALLSGADKEILITVAETVIAFAAVTLIPSERAEELRRIVDKSFFIKDRKLEKQVAAVLCSAAGNLSQVCEIINAAGDRIKGGGTDYINIASDLKIAELQRALTDQFSGISEYLYGLAEDVAQRRIPDEAKGASLKALLREGGVPTDEIGYFEDKNGAVTVEITLVDRAFDINWKRAKRIIEDFTLKSFERPELQVTQLRTVLTFSQKQTYRLQIGCAQKAADEASVCGDTVSAASSANGHGFALISDGMGTGRGAAADSRLTATVMKKLVCSGFSFESAAKTVNSALIARNGEESIATIDAVEIDLVSGEAVFYKAGASCSFVRKGERIATLQKKSLPVGILRGVSLSKARFRAQAGDIVLLVSDGVVQREEQWLSDALLSWGNDDMDELSMHILKLAALRQKGHADDMTVVAVRVEKNR